MWALVKSITGILKAAMYRSGQYLFYRYDPAQQGEGCLDPMVREYADYRSIPSAIRKRALRHFLVNPMYYRIRSHQARLLCIYAGGYLAGYGWIQSWRPFQRRFGWMYNRATMLGPYWTDPQHRGEGIYGRLLNHSLAIVDRTWPVVIYVASDNEPSRKGIEKAGFRLMGAYEVQRFLYFFQRHRELPAPDPKNETAHVRPPAA